MMKQVFLAGVALVMASGAVAAPKRLDLANPADVVTAQRKVQCSTRDGESVVYHFSGEVYSRVEGEPDKHIFDVEGMNIRQCVTVTDPARGKGYRMVSRELLLYTDTKTGAVMRSWANPWLGRNVDVVQVANDPVNMRASFPIGADGKPVKFSGRLDHGRIFMPAVIPLYYTNPLAGDYQDYVGNKYHSMEIFDFVAEEADLLDASKTRANPSIAWVRMSPWLPWMEMGSRNGLLVFNAVGQIMPNGITDLPKVMTDEIKLNYPIYDKPPPLDDARPNETSWTYFKKKVDARRAAEKAPAK